MAGLRRDPRASKARRADRHDVPIRCEHDAALLGQQFVAGHVLASPLHEFGPASVEIVEHSVGGGVQRPAMVDRTGPAALAVPLQVGLTGAGFVQDQTPIDRRPDHAAGDFLIRRGSGAVIIC